MRYLSFILIILFISKAMAQDGSLSQQDSVILRGRIVDFEDKTAKASIVKLYKNFKIEASDKLADIDFNDSLCIASALTDKNGEFELKALKDNYIIRISPLLSLNITQQISLLDSIVDLGIYDSFSYYSYLDEAPAMTLLRQRVYDRVMGHRKEGNVSKYNIVNVDEIESTDLESKVTYSEFKSDSEIISYYNSSYIIKEGTSDRKKSKKRMQAYISKMNKRYLKIEKEELKKVLSLEDR